MQIVDTIVTQPLFEQKPKIYRKPGVLFLRSLSHTPCS